jgi:hypothetical protein
MERTQMSELHIRIDLDNAAFAEAGEYEIGLLLDKAKTAIRGSGLEYAIKMELGGNLMDSNGNRVGRWEFKD